MSEFQNMQHYQQQQFGQAQAGQMGGSQGSIPQMGQPQQGYPYYQEQYNPYYQQYPVHQQYPYQHQQAMATQKWFYFSLALALLFLIQTGYTYYQTALKTERKIQKYQKLVRQQKEVQRRRENEKIEAERISQQLKDIEEKQSKLNGVDLIQGQLDSPSEIESNTPSPVSRQGEPGLKLDKIKGYRKKKYEGLDQVEKSALPKLQVPSTLKRNKTEFEKLHQLEMEKKENENHRKNKKPYDDCLSLSRKSSIIEDPMVASAKEREALNDSKLPITRICLTGGPCAGKTTALATLSLHLKQIGYRVLLVPEAATILMKGGALIQTPKMTFSSAVKFQTSLMKLQMNLEDIFVEIAQSSDSPTIILCDRGVMDGSAYTDENVWQAILDETGWGTIHLRDRRYEAVVHLVTAADGAEKFYTNTNNQARYESVQEAVELDKKLINAWVGHPQFSIIQNNEKSFQEKIDSCLSTVLNFIGLPSPSADVRKFLIVLDRNLQDAKIPKNIKREFFQLDETFLKTQTTENENEYFSNIVKKIGKNDSFIYSNEIKFIQNKEKIVKKKQLTAREYIELLDMKDDNKRQVRKIRQCFIYERQYFMVESFTNVDGTPSILRIETTGEGQKIKIPPFLKVLRDVTDEVQYKTKNMASLDYKMPEKDKINIQGKLIEEQDNQKNN